MQRLAGIRAAHRAAAAASRRGRSTQVKNINNNINKNYMRINQNPLVKRFMSALTGVDALGGDVVTRIKEGSGAIWVSNVYNLRGSLFGYVMTAGRVLFRLAGKESKYHDKIHSEITSSFQKLEFPHIRQIIPCFSEGGAFITFQTSEQASAVLGQLHGRVNVGGFSKKAYLVYGKPFIQDMSRTPSSKLRINIVPVSAGADAAAASTKVLPMSEESLFREFRVYGRIENIARQGEQWAIEFASTNGAVAARNCLHMRSDGARSYSIAYETSSRWAQIRDIVTNVRIMLPLIGLGITLSTYLLVDPIRITSVTQSLTLGYKDKQRSMTAGGARFGVFDVFNERQAAIRTEWRKRPDDRITILTGAAGSGKSTLLNDLLHRRSFSAYVDCTSVKTPQELVEALGTAVGFAPSFSTLNTALNWIESLIPGLKKTDISASTATQLAGILSALDSALLFLSAGFSNKDDQDFPVIVFDSFFESLEQIERAKNGDSKSDALLDILMEWASRNAHRARIVFVGENLLGAERVRASPFVNTGKINTIMLEDLSFEEVSELLRTQFADITADDCKKVFSTLGGRIADLLEFLEHVRTFVEKHRGAHIPVSASDSQKIETLPKVPEGWLVRNTVSEAVASVLTIQVQEEHDDFRHRAFGDNVCASSDAPAKAGLEDRPWTQIQMWRVIKLVAACKPNELAYDDLLYRKVLKGDNVALKAMVKEKLLHVTYDERGIKRIDFRSPLLRAAVRLMMNSKIAQGKMDLMEVKDDIKGLMKETRELEAELVDLTKGSAGGRLNGIQARREVINARLLRLAEKLQKKQALRHELEDANPL